MAAKGKISFVHPQNKIGMIDRTDETGHPDYVFKIPEGLTDPNYIPTLGTEVIFIPGNGQTASGVAKAEILSCKLNASLTNVPILTNVTLDWTTTGAVSASINPIIGAVVVPTGSKTIQVSATETYILTATDSLNNKVTDLVTITVY